MKKLFSLIFAICMIMTSMAAVFAADLPFEDVKTSDWFYNDVKTAYETGLINGKSETAYAPNDNMTYAEAIKLAACMNQYAAEGAVTLESGNPWYQTYVEYAEDNGIISKSYDYSKNATRSGYMEIFASCLPEENLKEINSIEDNSIPDVKSKESYALAVYKLYRAGILTGVDDEHNCNPSANIKRSEVAAILTRMMNPDKRVSFSMGSDSKKNDDPKKDDPKNDEPKNDELTITAQPKNAAVAKGADATFTVVVAGGKEPYTYEWYYCYPNDSKFFKYTDKAEYYEWFKGVDTAALTVKQLDASLENSRYYCVITDAEGNKVTSDAATLTVMAAPALTITTQPKDAKVNKGADATFTVAVSGGKEPYTYEWYYCYPNDSKFFKCTDRAEYYEWFKGVDTATLTVKQLDDSLEFSKYYCVVTDGEGNSVTSDAASLSIPTGPLDIIGQPLNATVLKGADAKFNVAVSGGKAPYTYEWYYCYPNDSKFFKCTDRAEYYEWFTGVNAAALTVKQLDASLENSRYYCVITDADGNKVTSNTATLTIDNTLAVSAQPQSFTVAKGGNADFFVSVSGGKTPYTFQWYCCNSGQNSFSRCEDAAEWYEHYTIDSTGGNYSVLTVKHIGEYMSQDGAQYYCVITDEEGKSVTSDTAVLTIK